MEKLTQNKSSFRDSNGYILQDDHGNIYRAITDKGLENFIKSEESGLLESLIKENLLISYEKLKYEDYDIPIPQTKLLLSHPRLPFISYPYEWTFEQLKAAALLHLDIHIRSLEHNITLSDATAYNIQFIGHQPVFIDHLSFVPYNEGMLWKGQQQFIDQFISPLLMWHHLKLPHNELYRGSFFGIPASHLNALIPFYKKFSLSYLMYITLPCIFEKKNTAKPLDKSKSVKQTLPKSGLLFILRQLKNWVSRLKNPHQKTLWDNYSDFRNYDDAEVLEKHSFIKNHISDQKPITVLDIGSNTGEFSFSALEAGAEYAIGLELDPGAVSRSYIKSREKKASFLPLCVNLLNPSPNMGWDQEERQGIKMRAHADFVLSLAVVHHLSIGGNVPLESVISSIVRSGKAGIIEWIPKTDGMIKTMLLNREDIFTDYTEECFIKYLQKHARILDQKVISKTGRTLFFYERMN